MDQSKKSGSATPLVATLAMTLGATAASAGCADHRLPPNPVPTLAFRQPPPEWFDPNAVWDPNKPGDTRVYIKGKIVFDTDKATIKKGESEQVLKDLHKFLVDNPWVTRLRVEGHTDSRASDEHNEELSAERSLAVCHWLVENGIDHIRLVAVGYGEKKPIGPNETEAGRQENRRTEFHVMEVEGKPYGPKNALAGGRVLTVLSAEELYLKKHPPKPVFPKPKPFNPTGNDFDRYKPAPAKPIDPDAVIKAPGSGDSPGDAGPIKKDDKKDEKKEGGGGAAGGGAGGAAPPQ
ncbi:MAG: OmpA family protein [Polyangiaceae bacterium]|nr:OmpA family protein [Polyangiaceae bacterium]